LLLLVGDAGVGKTRTAEEAAALAARRGCRVRWGRCHEDQGMPPWWPWTELLRACLRDHVTGDAARNAGVSARLAELLPELAVSDPPGRSTRRSYDAARFQLFDAVTSTLEHAAQRAPILAVIEDLHWGDEASTALLAFVSRRFAASRILVLGTCRDEPHTFASGLTTVLRGSATRTLPLDALTRDEVAALFTALGRPRLSAALLTAIHRQTGGNPFFVTEIARWMTSGDGAPAAGDASQLRIPGSVWSVIRRRLDQLDAATRDLMRIAAALGGRFESRLLRDLHDNAMHAQLPALLDEACGENVIIHEQGGTFSFRHPLIRQALYEEIPRAARTQLHGHIADVWRSRAGADVTAFASEIAHHLGRAGSERDPISCCTRGWRASRRRRQRNPHRQPSGRYRR